MPYAATTDQLLEAIRELKDLVAEMNTSRFADQLITNDELVLMLGISKRTAQDWRDQGILPYAQLGKKVFYRLRDLEAMFDEQFRKDRRVKKQAQQRSKTFKKGRKGNGWDIRF